jgi:hypothetical protein
MSSLCPNQHIIAEFQRRIAAIDDRDQILRKLELKCKHTHKELNECEVFDKLISQNLIWKDPTNMVLQQEIDKCKLFMTGMVDKDEFDTLP